MSHVNKLGAPSAPTPTFTQAIHAARTHTEVVVPRTGMRALMRVPSMAEAAEAARLAREAYAGEIAAAPSGGAVWADVEAARVLHMIAAAVRDPDDPGKPLAPAAAWAQLDEVALGEVATQLEAVRTALAPDPDFADIREMCRRAGAADPLTALRSYTAGQLARALVDAVGRLAPPPEAAP